jgi:hypothetical protein
MSFEFEGTNRWAFCVLTASGEELQPCTPHIASLSRWQQSN